MRRKRGWGRVIFGVGLMVAGIAAIIIGIFAIVGELDRIEDDAVVRGQMGETLTFTAAEAGDYTVYLVGGPDVSTTACRVTVAGGGRLVLAGAQQDVEYTIGNASSIGRFDTEAGDVEISCEPAFAGEYMVTPGAPDIVPPILGIVAGGFAIFLGIGLFIWGLIGKRVPAA